jgi:hypothetical protein
MMFPTLRVTHRHDIEGQHMIRQWVEFARPHRSVESRVCDKRNADLPKRRSILGLA